MDGERRRIGAHGARGRSAAATAGRRPAGHTRRRLRAAEDNAARVRRAVEEIWNAGNLDLADVLFAPTYVNHAGIIPDLVRGPEAIKLSVALYRTAFPGLHISIDELRADGDMVALRWTARSTPPGMRIVGAPTGRRGTLTGTTSGRLVGGKIVESWTDWDAAGVLGRLGVQS
jgi:predicted SnoaL-like aldol condensation-catalyzing enzyme